MAEIEMVIDSVRVSLMNYQRVVILKEKEGKRYLPCWVGPAEADAISVKMQGVSVPRPLTHDFVCAVIDNLKATVKHAIISDLKKDTFYAKVVLITDDERIEIDCRPSDALAVALRVGAPIFADDQRVLDKAGILLDEEDKTQGIVLEPERKPSKFEKFSQSAQDILTLGEQEAKRLNHNFVGTGHLLLALVKDTPTTASELLKNLGIDLTKIPVEIETNINQRSSIEAVETGLTSAVKEAIELSIAEAKRLGAKEVQTEHIVLGLIRQSDGIAGSLLKNRGINVEKVYGELIRLYTQSWFGQEAQSSWQ